MMCATTLGGGETWFGPYAIKIQCQPVVKMIGLKTIANGGLMEPKETFYVN